MGSDPWGLEGVALQREPVVRKRAGGGVDGEFVALAQGTWFPSEPLQPAFPRWARRSESGLGALAF